MEVRFRGKGLNITPTRATHSRKALLYQNKIRTVLKHLGCHPDDFEFSDIRLAMKREEAWVKFWSKYEHCHISCNSQSNYADNMQVIAALLEHEEKLVESGEEDLENFFDRYSEDDEIDKQRIEARKTLGVDEDCMDWEIVDAAYKTLARTAHPDMGGSIDEFKKINLAHKLLKRELL